MSSNFKLAVAYAVRDLSVGLEKYLDEPMKSLNDWFGAGADEFVGNLAKAYGDKIVYVQFDDPQAALGGFGVVSSTNDWQAESKNIDGVTFVVVYTKGQYIDSGLMFAFGVTGPHAIRKRVPGLVYESGDQVETSSPFDKVEVPA